MQLKQFYDIATKVSSRKSATTFREIPDWSRITHAHQTQRIQYTNYRMMTSSNGSIFRVTGPLCGEFTGPGEFPAQRPVTRSFDVFFDLRLNKRLSKQWWGWWFETLSHPLWRHRNGDIVSFEEFRKDAEYLIHYMFCRFISWSKVLFYFSSVLRSIPYYIRPRYIESLWDPQNRGRHLLCVSDWPRFPISCSIRSMISFESIPKRNTVGVFSLKLWPSLFLHIRVVIGH